jgi:type II secretory pathway pseudopilin PulG
MIQTVYVKGLVLLAAFVAGGVVNGWRIEARYAEKEKVAAKALKTAQDERDTLSKKLTDSNDAHATELKKAQDETNTLRNGIDSGAYSLRIKAKCPAIPVLPQAPSPTRVDSGAGAELDSDARRAYYALRSGIDRASAQLAACQGELRLRTEID